MWPTSSVCRKIMNSQISPLKLVYLKHKKEIVLAIKTENSSCISSVDWIKAYLFPKIIKWAETADVKNESSGLVTSSITLVNIAKYSKMYQELKKKYALQMVQIWPENTDPLKFVYEDVAIATYLLLLWEQERLQRGTPDAYQTFVDLGCGNGLLVHILSSEGHQGVGLDVRKRKIWDLYPSSTKLQVQSIFPSAECLFPEADWLIGNHSDELTPWIPIIAARSSRSCRFFLLPCCCYELNGQKYQRNNSSHSQYMDYLDYIYKLCKVCGFTTKIDRLRIPSTKRICLVGCERNYPEHKSLKMDRDIQFLIDSKTSKRMEATIGELSGCSEIKGSTNKWVQDVRIREKEEKVRNCTQLHRGFVEEILKLVTEQLLSKHYYILVSSMEGEKRLWNAGEKMLLAELASLIPREKLKQLKNECGGVQTLLKNNGYVFLVEHGYVQLRVPSVNASFQENKPISRRKRHSPGNIRNVSRKQKLCWFHFNHPDGCPLSDDDCSYRHG
ncbi:putative tRNA (uracil-O(2)-)-methyltransferase [Zootermopsis nevadensis]|uniref:tRNA (uracil-O(2)-)-methyltransferase n=1 Tax=Zootermopsis nevadensis TaxID=136037 RepID=A0A067RAV4_ZOONE|nr:putative tRNA (uracil-O(2)-)-methyltransferase [Zootermopsis nevadensis]